MDEEKKLELFFIIIFFEFNYLLAMYLLNL